MIKSRLSSASEIPTEDVKKGFTIIEVMLFLAITGLLLLTVLGGTYASIATQRYNDSVRDFAEFLRQTYAEVISPESIGSVDGDFGGGNSDDYAIYGKVIVFGLDSQVTTGDPSTVYTATIVGDTKIPSGKQDFIRELASVNARIFCGIEVGGVTTYESTVDRYIPLWETQIWNTKKQPLEGTLIIARSPTSGTVHTAFSSDKNAMPDLATGCTPTSMAGANQAPASNTFYRALQSDLNNGTNYFQLNEVNFCLKSDQSNIIRDIRLAADGHNNTAISIINDDDGDNKCR